MKNWKTNVFGAGGLLAVLTAVLNSMFDGDPATNPDWTPVIAVASTCIGLFFAKDNNVTGGKIQQ
jgi:hypothetical protein